MMHVLLESRATSAPRRARWTVMSVGVHASLIAAAVIATTRAPSVSAIPFRPDSVVFVATPQPPAREAQSGGTSEGVLRVPRLKGLDIPDVPHIDALPTGLTGLDRIIPDTSLISANPPGGGPSNGIFSAAAVDRTVLPRLDNPRPEYPRQPRAAGLEGSVLTRFVVDTAGRVERGSIEIVQATHALFADAVREWLPRTRYSPAESHGRRVRQLVEQRIAFALR
jgi:protein TonB